jgi:hypothetical protein
MNDFNGDEKCIQLIPTDVNSFAARRGDDFGIRGFRATMRSSDRSLRG